MQKFLNEICIPFLHCFKGDNLKYTRFERARIIGARALQIAMGAPLLIKPKSNVIDPVQLAIIEFEEGVIPITVRRRGKFIKGAVV